MEFGDRRMSFNRISARLLIGLCFCLVYLPRQCVTAESAVQAEPGDDDLPPLDEKLRNQIKIEIEDLADELIAAKAEASLLTIGLDAVPQLQEAAKSPNPNVAERAKRVLWNVAAHTHVVRGALGKPIPKSKVEVEIENPTTNRSRHTHREN